MELFLLFISQLSGLLLRSPGPELSLDAVMHAEGGHYATKTYNLASRSWNFVECDRNVAAGVALSEVQDGMGRPLVNAAGEYMLHNKLYKKEEHVPKLALDRLAPAAATPEWTPVGTPAPRLSPRPSRTIQSGSQRVPDPLATKNDEVKKKSKVIREKLFNARIQKSGAVAVQEESLSSKKRAAAPLEAARCEAWLRQPGAKSGSAFGSQPSKPTAPPVASSAASSKVRPVLQTGSREASLADIHTTVKEGGYPRPKTPRQTSRPPTPKQSSSSLTPRPSSEPPPTQQWKKQWWKKLAPAVEEAMEEAVKTKKQSDEKAYTKWGAADCSSTDDEVKIKNEKARRVMGEGGLSNQASQEPDSLPGCLSPADLDPLIKAAMNHANLVCTLEAERRSDKKKMAADVSAAAGSDSAASAAQQPSTKKKTPAKLAGPPKYDDEEELPKRTVKHAAPKRTTVSAPPGGRSHLPVEPKAKKAHIARDEPGGRSPRVSAHDDAEADRSWDNDSVDSCDSIRSFSPDSIVKYQVAKDECRSLARLRSLQLTRLRSLQPCDRAVWCVDGDGRWIPLENGDKDRGYDAVWEQLEYYWARVQEAPGRKVETVRWNYGKKLIYEYDVADMTQTRTDTGKERSIKRFANDQVYQREEVPRRKHQGTPRPVSSSQEQQHNEPPASPSPHRPVTKCVRVPAEEPEKTQQMVAKDAANMVAAEDAKDDAAQRVENAINKHIEKFINSCYVGDEPARLIRESSLQCRKWLLTKFNNPKEDRARDIRSVDGWVRAHLDCWDPDSRVGHYHAADDKTAPDMSTTITTSPPPPD